MSLATPEVGRTYRRKHGGYPLYLTVAHVGTHTIYGVNEWGRRVAYDPIVFALAYEPAEGKGPFDLQDETTNRPQAPS